MLKNNHFFITNFLFLALSFHFVSCSDLNKEPEDAPRIVESLQTCGADLDTFTNFFNESTEVQREFDCLHKDLKFFITIVKSDKPGYLPLSNLLEYLRNDPDSGYDEDMKNIITAFFDISHLIVGGEKGFVSRKNVDDIVELLKFLNREIVKVYKLIQDSDVNYARHRIDRAAIERTLIDIQRYIVDKKIFNTTDNRRSLDLKTLIERFETSENSLAIEKALSLLFIKKAMLGGDTDQITSDQFFSLKDGELFHDSLFGKIIELGLLSFDASKLSKIIFQSQAEEMGFYQSMVFQIKEILFETPVQTSIVTNVADVTKAVDLLAPNLISDGVFLQKFNNNIAELKDILFGSNDPAITFEEIHNLLDLGLEVFDMGVYFNERYQENNDILYGPNRISTDLVDCRSKARNSTEASYCKRFNRIARDYRYFGGSFKLPFFSDFYYRNTSGVFEIGLMERLLENVFVYYDDDDQPVSDRRSTDEGPDYRDGVNKNKDPKDYTLYLRQVRHILKTYSGLLNEVGVVVPGRIFGREDIASSDNVVLMSSLFQNQSNGSDSNDRAYVDIPEFTELAISILSAIELKDFFSEKMLDYCSGSLIDGKVSPDCFRQKFAQVIKTPITGSPDSIADYMPKLANYLDTLNEDKMYDYVKESEKFTKMCMNYSLTLEEFSTALDANYLRSSDFGTQEGEEIPLSKTDMFAVFAGLFNAESTINRFDVNNDNKMNPSEIDTAFNEVYQGVLRNIVKGDSRLNPITAIFGKTKVARWIFRYMIKKETTPNGIGFLFHGNKTSATRKKIAAILTAVGEQSDSNSPGDKCYNPYCCDVFRQVIDSQTGKPRDLNKSEFDKVVKACRIKFKKDNYSYPYNVCERI